MVSQLADNVGFMDIFGIHLVLRCLAKLGQPVEPELLKVGGSYWCRAMFR